MRRTMPRPARAMRRTRPGRRWRRPAKRFSAGRNRRSSSRGPSGAGSLSPRRTNEPIKQDLVKMLVELAGKINAKTIVEGIETVEEYEACRELGIDLLQGDYLAHPQEQLRLGDDEVARLTTAV